MQRFLVLQTSGYVSNLSLVLIMKGHSKGPTEERNKSQCRRLPSKDTFALREYVPLLMNLDLQQLNKG